MEYGEYPDAVEGWRIMEIIREHGRCGGFPVDAVHEVRAIIDPTTAELATAGTTAEMAG